MYTKFAKDLEGFRSLIRGLIAVVAGCANCDELTKKMEESKEAFLHPGVQIVGFYMNILVLMVKNPEMFQVAQPIMLGLLEGVEGLMAAGDGERPLDKVTDALGLLQRNIEQLDAIPLDPKWVLPFSPRVPAPPSEV